MPDFLGREITCTLFQVNQEWTL